MSNLFSKTRIFYISMTLIIALEIFLFSSIETPLGEQSGLNLATLYHLAIFFAFTFFLTLSIKTKNLNKKTIAIIFLISLIYAISDEFHQLFVIGRFASIKDIIIDMIGSSLAILILKILEIFKKI